MDKHIFECGCSFPIVGPPIGKSKIPLLDLNLDIESINMNCPGTWQLISKGLTKGVFQLESNLGKQYAKKLRPENIEHMAALGSLLRPGSLRALDDKGISMTDHYCLRKNKEEETVIKYPELNEILGPTYDVLCIEENTLIGLADGRHIPIKNIMKNDIVNTLLDNKLVNSICDGVGFSKNDDGYNIVLKNNNNIILTKDHNILTLDGWKPVENLDIKHDLIAVAIKIKTSSNFKNIANWLGTDKDVAYLFGQIVGDGNNTNSLNIATGSLEKTEKLFTYFKKVFKNCNIKKYFHTRCWYISINCPILLNPLSHKRSKTRFRQLMENYNLNINCYNKRIPDNIFMGTDEIKLSFLAGLFDSDGYSGQDKNGNAIRSFCSCNPNLLLDIQRLLLHFGIYGYISSKNHYYISNIIDFDKVIKDYIIIKKLVGNPLTGKHYGEEYLSNVRKLIKNISIAKFCKAINVEKSLFRKNKKFISSNTAFKFGIDHEEVRYIRIKSINKISNCKFYKMSVRHTNNLVANTIIIKNCYQEQSMQLATKVAGFNEQEADNLRRAIGKKKTDEMSKVKTIFLEKGEKLGILSKEALDEVFGWIEKSQRYSFNKSHAVGYALNGYLSAYCKYHFPLQFYTSYLANSKNNQKPSEEIRELVNDTKLMKIEVKTHDIRMKNHDFINDGESIYFGLRNIKGVGDSGCKNIDDVLALFNIQNTTWFEILVKFSRHPSLFEKLILSGCFDFLKLQRQYMLYELHCLNKLSEGELDWVHYNAHRFTSLKEALVAALKPKYKVTKKKKDLALLLTEIKPVDLDDYGAAATIKSVNKIKSIIKLLENPPISLDDTVDFIVQNEEELLGVAITCSRIDDKNTYTANCTCAEFIKINQKSIIIAAEVQEVKVIKIKNGPSCGRQMAFLTISDSTGSLPDITIFADAYDKYKNMLQINNTIMLKGKKDYKRKCLIADEIYQL